MLMTERLSPSFVMHQVEHYLLESLLHLELLRTMLSWLVRSLVYFQGLRLLRPQGRRLRFHLWLLIRLFCRQFRLGRL